MPLIKFVTSTERRRARIAPCYEEARAQLCTASRQSVLRQLAEYEQKLKEVHAEDCGGRNPDEGISFVALAKMMTRSGLTPKLIGHKSLKIMVAHAKLGNTKRQGVSFSEFCEVLVRCAVLMVEHETTEIPACLALVLDSVTGKVPGTPQALRMSEPREGTMDIAAAMPSPVVLATPSPAPEKVITDPAKSPAVISPGTALLEMMMNSEDLKSMVASPPTESLKPPSGKPTAAEKSAAPAEKSAAPALTPPCSFLEQEKDVADEEASSQRPEANRLHVVPRMMRAAHNHGNPGVTAELWEAGEAQEMSLRANEIQGDLHIREETKAAAALERKRMQQETLLELEALDAAAEAKDAALRRVQVPHPQAKAKDEAHSGDCIAVMPAEVTGDTTKQREAEREAAFRKELLEKEAADLQAKEAAKQAMMELKALELAAVEKREAEAAANANVKREMAAHIARENQEEAHATAEQAEAELKALEAAFAAVSEVKAARFASSPGAVATEQDQDTATEKHTDAAMTETMPGTTPPRVLVDVKNACTLYSSVSDVLAHAKATAAKSIAEKAAAKLPQVTTKNDVTNKVTVDSVAPTTPKEKAILRGKQMFTDKLAAATVAVAAAENDPTPSSVATRSSHPEHKLCTAGAIAPSTATSNFISSVANATVSTVTDESSATNGGKTGRQLHHEADATPPGKLNLNRPPRSTPTSAGGFWGGADEWLQQNSTGDNQSAVSLRQAMSLVGKVSHVLGASVGVGLITTFHNHCDGELEFGKLPLGNFFKLWRKAGVVSEVGHADLLHLFADFVDEPTLHTVAPADELDADEEAVTLCGFLRLLPTMANLLKPAASRIDAMTCLLQHHLLPLAESSANRTPERNRTGEFSTGCLARMEKVMDDPGAVNVFVRRAKDLAKLLGRYDGRPDGSSVTCARLDTLARMAQDVAITPELLTQRELAALFQLEARAECNSHKAAEGLNMPQVICLLLRAAAVAYPELDGTRAANALLSQFSIPPGMGHRRHKSRPPGTPKAKATPRMRSSPSPNREVCTSPSRQKAVNSHEPSPKSRQQAVKGDKRSLRGSVVKQVESIATKKPPRKGSSPCRGKQVHNSTKRRSTMEKPVSSLDTPDVLPKAVQPALRENVKLNDCKGQDRGDGGKTGGIRKAAMPDGGSSRLPEHSCVAFVTTEPPAKTTIDDYSMLLKKSKTRDNLVMSPEPAGVIDSHNSCDSRREQPHGRLLSQQPAEADVWNGDTSVCMSLATASKARAPSEGDELVDTAWQDVDVMSFDASQDRQSTAQADNIFKANACDFAMNEKPAHYRSADKDDVIESIWDSAPQGPGSSPVLRVLQQMRRSQPPTPINDPSESTLTLDLSHIKEREGLEIASWSDNKKATHDDCEDTDHMSIVRKASERTTESSAEAPDVSPRCIRMSDAFGALLHGEVIPDKVVPDEVLETESPLPAEEPVSQMLVSVSPLSQPSPSASPTTPAYVSPQRMCVTPWSGTQPCEALQEESGGAGPLEPRELHQQVETELRSAKVPHQPVAVENNHTQGVWEMLNQHSKPLRLIFNYYCKKDRSASSWDTGVSAKQAQGQVLMQADLERLARHLDLFPAFCSKRVLTALFNEARKESHRGGRQAKPFGGLNFLGFRLWLARVMEQSGEKSDLILKRIANSQGIRRLEAALDTRSGSLAAQLLSLKGDVDGRLEEGFTEELPIQSSPALGQAPKPLLTGTNPGTSRRQSTKASRAAVVARGEAVLHGHLFEAFAGTLKRIFVAYADSCPGRKTTLDPGEVRSYDEAITKKASLSRLAYLRFAQDFNLMPGLVSRVELDRIFSAPRNNIRDMDGEWSMHEDHVRKVGESLHFDLYSLVASLQGIAHVGFAKPCNCMGPKIVGLRARCAALIKLMRESSGVGRVEALERAAARLPRRKGTTRSTAGLAPLFSETVAAFETTQEASETQESQHADQQVNRGSNEDHDSVGGEAEKPPPPPAPPPIKHTVPSMGQIFCDKVVKDTVAGRLAAAACWRSEQQTKLRGIFEASTVQRDLLGLPRMNFDEFSQLLQVMRFQCEEEEHDHRSYFDRAVSHDAGPNATISYTEFVEAMIDLFAVQSKGSHRKLRTEVEITHAADTFMRVLMEQHISRVTLAQGSTSTQGQKEHPTIMIANKACDQECEYTSALSPGAAVA